jgi:filamentous hemagglutinin
VYFQTANVDSLVSSGNITAGNISAGTGTITGGNVNGANFNGNVAFGTGTVGGSGNITGGNLLFGSGVVSGTGNVSAGNLNVTGNIVDSGALTIITGSNGNIALAPNGTGIVTASGNISAAGNITSAANIASGNLSVTGNITGNTAGFAIGYRDIPQVSLASNVTTALTDAGKHYYSTSASNLALTIANNTSVVWPVGTAVTIVNGGTASILINQGTGVSMYLAGNATAGNRVLSTFGMATVINTAANVWFISGTGLT